MNTQQNQPNQKIVPNPLCEKCGYILQKHHKSKKTGVQHYYCNRCKEIFPKHQRESYKIKNPLRQILIGLILLGIRISAIAACADIKYASLRKCLALFISLVPKVKLKVIKVGLYQSPDCCYIIRHNDIGPSGSALIDFTGGISVVLFKRIKVPLKKSEKGYELLDR
jgi:hypothetical protein